uniref:Corticotropin releasing hormone n=1 Tax=Gasterosteus aculeatus aculeatus TaxID=481459 RepID=A0AAQ4QWT3_GASAC
MNVLLCLVVALGVSPPADCRPADCPASFHRLLPRPLLLHLGEELSLRVGGGPPTAASPGLLPSSPAVNRVLEVEEGAGGMGRRSEEAPISLDLTFHLLRGVLEMARAEQMAQQADSNRKMMDTFGK